MPDDKLLTLEEIKRIAGFVFSLDNMTGVETGEVDKVRTAVLVGVEAQDARTRQATLKEVEEWLESRIIGTLPDRTNERVELRITVNDLIALKYHGVLLWAAKPKLK